MQNFKFVRSATLEGACRFLEENPGKVKLIAGGTDLMIEIRNDKLLPEIETILEIGHLEELRFIVEDGDFIRFGAAVTHAEAAKNKLIRKNAGLLAEASGTVGSPQIRNRGTIAGNIITASPAADTIPPLLVLEAEVLLRRGDQTRNLPLEALYSGSNRVIIGNDELLVGIYFKKPSATARTAFLKLARRNSAAKSRMNFAALARQKPDGEVVELRIAAGAVTPYPTRFRSAENRLLGKIPQRALLKEAGKLVAAEMIRQSGIRWSTDYKKPVVKSLTQRILYQVLEVD